MTPAEAQSLVFQAEQRGLVLLAILAQYGIADGEYSSAAEREARRMGRAWGRCRERWEERAVACAAAGDLDGQREAQVRAAWCHARMERWARP